MRLGDYEIKGVSRRFWYIIGGFVVLLIAIFSLLPSSTPPPNPLVIPAFSTDKLDTLPANWIEPYISNYGLRQPEKAASFTSSYSVNLGLPFRFRAYIPSQAALANSPKLEVTKYGYQFLPAIFLDPTASLSPDDFTSLDDQLSSGGRPIVLGFPENQTPAAGQAYEITGLLYWNSGQLTQSAGSAAPIILTASARPLAASELSAPTTHLANLNLTYQEKDLQLSLGHVEWSSGRQVRVCVSLTNVGSPNPLNRWSGLDNFRAEYPESTGQGSSTATADPNSPLATQTLLDQNTTVTGYIIFDQPPAAAPDSGMTLFVPPLSASGIGPPTAIRIAPSQFTDAAATNRDSRGDASDGCYS